MSGERRRISGRAGARRLADRGITSSTSSPSWSRPKRDRALLDRAVRRLQLLCANLLPERGTVSRGSLGETRRCWIWQPISQAVWNIYHRG